MAHLPGVINSSDNLTKALTWVLHARHALRSMGHYEDSMSNELTSKSMASSQPMLEAGKGVGAQVYEGGVAPVASTQVPSESLRISPGESNDR